MIKWRLKKFKDKAGLGKALVTVLRIEGLEAERETIEKKLNEIHDRWLKALESYKDAGLEERKKLDSKFQVYEELMEQFREVLKKNEAEMEACQKAYLKSLSLEQIKKRCSAIHV